MPRKPKRHPGKKNPEGATTISLGAERRKRVDAFRDSYAKEHGVSFVNLEDAVRILIDRALSARGGAA